jgi:GNAT superfamily N-acetyltransferase
MSQNQYLEIKLIESPSVTAAEVANLYRSSGIRRPVDDLARIGAMLRHANLIVGAYQDGQLVGLARAVTDFSYCCYLSDLAVSKENQKQGIGKQLIEYFRERLGPQVMLLLLASPEAMSYYPGAGFAAVDNGWIIKRTA